MKGETYSLCEAVADMSRNFITQDKKPANSREFSRLCIEWAEEFETKNDGVEWGVNGREYIEEIDQFFQDKFAEWLDVTPPGELLDDPKTGLRLPLPEAEELRRGELIVRCLMLKKRRAPDKPERAIYNTADGTKSTLGLFRTVARIVLDGE